MEKNIYIKIRESLKDNLRHMAIPQNGSSVIVLNKDSEILLLKKSNGGGWVIPGGVQELGEDFKKVAKRELEEETGLDFELDRFKFISVFTGESRHRFYPNGDEVYNNTALYLVDNVDKSEIDISGLDWQDNDGSYELVQESTSYGWFKIDELPKTMSGKDDLDLVEYFIEWQRTIK